MRQLGPKGLENIEISSADPDEKLAGAMIVREGGIVIDFDQQKPTGVASADDVGAAQLAHEASPLHMKTFTSLADREAGEEAGYRTQDAVARGLDSAASRPPTNPQTATPQGREAWVKVRVRDSLYVCSGSSDPTCK